MEKETAKIIIRISRILAEEGLITGEEQIRITEFLQYGHTEQIRPDRTQTE